MKSRRPFLPSILTVMTVLGCGGSGSGDAPPASTPPAPAVDVRRATYPLDPSFADLGLLREFLLANWYGLSVEVSSRDSLDGDPLRDTITDQANEQIVVVVRRPLKHGWPCCQGVDWTG